jgi:putative ABC transport system permease protein
MMTGQILSGIEPMVAVRYQIMVMCMVFGSGGLGAVLYLAFRPALALRPTKGDPAPT